MLREHLGEFFRDLRGRLAGQAFAYAWVPEWHKTDHGLHAHFAVGRFIARSKIEAAWPHGFVHIKLIGDLPVGSGRLSESRVAAGYLSKYVAKSFDDNKRLMGLHRYDVAQGFQPERVRLLGRSSGDVLRQASDLLGCAPAQVWSSLEAEEWQAPPAVWAQWGV